MVACLVQDVEVAFPACAVVAFLAYVGVAYLAGAFVVAYLVGASVVAFPAGSYVACLDLVDASTEMIS